MKTVNVDIEVDLAKQLSAILEEHLANKIKLRNEISVEIQALEERIKAFRAKIFSGTDNLERAATGDNKTRIREYLKTIVGNTGARASEIQKITGIGTSSVAFTLKNYTDDFVQDGKLWKLK